MQRELVRIGIDRPAAYAVGSPSDWASASVPTSGYPRVTYTDLADQLASDPDLLLLDLRRNSEWDDGHLAGAKHVPLHELRGRIDEVVAWAGDHEVWVYCGSGFRASIGASILDASGVRLIHVDDDFANAAKAGISVSTPDHGARIGEAYAD